MRANVGSDVRPRTGDSLVARLLRRLLHGLGEPTTEFHFLWSGERVLPAAAGPHEYLRDAESLERVRQLLGHADSKITERVYQRKPEIVRQLR
jgi:hypothetical protein